MAKQRQDLLGRRFSRLVVVGLGKVEIREGSYGRISDFYWRCKCDCGNEIDALPGNLTSGRSKSCGCLNREKTSKRFRTHGMTNTPEYSTWLKLNARCDNPNDKRFANYGGRGIQCKFKTFEEFLAHVGPRPSRKHSIDRINNDGHYEPGNVRWAGRITQVRNRSNTITLCYLGSDRPLGEWAEIFGVKYDTLLRRRQKGWPPEEILFGKQ